jgi:predicted ATP-dependent Lon-type protease
VLRHLAFGDSQAALYGVFSNLLFVLLLPSLELVAFDAGAKRLLLPMASVKDIPTVPGELFAKFQTGFYADATDAIFKALGVG